MWLIIILGSVPPLWPLFKAITQRARSFTSSERSTRPTKISKGSQSAYRQFDADGLRMEPLSKSSYNIQSFHTSRKGTEGDSDSETTIDWFRPRDQILVTKETHVGSSYDFNRV